MHRGNDCAPEFEVGEKWVSVQQPASIDIPLNYRLLRGMNMLRATTATAADASLEQMLIWFRPSASRPLRRAATRCS
jgi:hypothetical protein